jgi:hypothetical protein
LLRNSAQMAVSEEQVGKAGRDLGANLSRNGRGLACFASKQMQTILEFSEIMQNAELRNAFGARDLWQVIERVNIQYLGGAGDMHRHRTQSIAGAVIIRWIAKYVHRLTGLGGSVISMGQILEPQLHPASVATIRSSIRPTGTWSTRAINGSPAAAYRMQAWSSTHSQSRRRPRAPRPSTCRS